jgi:hypothetical protein
VIGPRSPIIGSRVGSLTEFAIPGDSPRWLTLAGRLLTYLAQQAFHGRIAQRDLVGAIIDCLQSQGRGRCAHYAGADQKLRNRAKRALGAIDFGIGWG